MKEKSGKLAEKTALITGGARRLGRATAIALAEEGVNVLIHYKSSSKEAEELRDEIKSMGVESWITQADFNNEEEYEILLDRAFDIAGKLDFLVNNASIFPKGTLDDITREDMRLNFTINTWVPFELTRAFAARSKQGKVVNFLDARIMRIDNDNTAYYLSKKALETLTRMTALEYAPALTVNAVAPGLILPPPGKSESYLEKLAHKVPMKKHGMARDVTDAVLFLLKSDFITGQIIYIDGGRHLKGIEN